MRTISVALTTFNGGPFIDQQLASLAGQTRLPAELVVGDDGSTDDTVARLHRFAASAPFPVRVRENPARLGWRRNFMETAQRCGADLIAFCDQDDIWRSDKLAVAASAFDDPETVLFFHNASLIDRAGVPLGPADIYRLAPYNPPLTVHSPFSPYGFCIVFDRSLLQFSDIWERSIDCVVETEHAGHDQWIFFLAAVFGAIVYSDERLADYRQHGANAFGAPTNRGLQKRIAQFRYWITNPGTGYARLARAMLARADILGDCQKRLDGTWRERAVRGEQGCRRLAARFDARARLFQSRSPVAAARGITGLLRDGAYAADDGWGVGRHVLAKDVLLGLILRPLLVAPTQADPKGPR